MARPPIPTPTPVATPTPTPPPASTPPAPAPSPVIRRWRTAAHTAPPARIAYTRHATAGDRDDRIVNLYRYRFMFLMTYVGGVAILVLFLFGGIQWGRAMATSPTVPAVSAPPSIVALTPSSIPPPPPPPRWSSHDECERYYVLTLHEAPAGRC